MHTGVLSVTLLPAFQLPGAMFGERAKGCADFHAVLCKDSHRPRGSILDEEEKKHNAAVSNA